MSSVLQNLPSDEQLTAAVAAGDHAAFEELYRRYARPLGAYGARVLRDRSRGVDVAQTALMRAFDALRRGTEPLRVKPWLYKIALNTALELKAKNGEVLDGESEELEDTSLDMRAARADILGGVQNLPERQRKVFVLREIKGLPVGEVARRLELTNQQVEQALFAARNRLAEVLVFGERVDCETVRGLDRSQLTHYERRALKSHMRACPSCKRKRGFGLSAIGFWLRDACAWLAGGGASAAKLGAVAVTATVVGGVPAVAPDALDRVLRQEAKASSIAPAATQRTAPRRYERPARLSKTQLSRSVPQAVALPPESAPLADPPTVQEELATVVFPTEAAAGSPAPAPIERTEEGEPDSIEAPPADLIVEREPMQERNITPEPVPNEEPAAEEPLEEPPADTSPETRADEPAPDRSAP
jgi:RNA polymerase sigma factor (sigma-70 family)